MIDFPLIVDEFGLTIHILKSINFAGTSFKISNEFAEDGDDHFRRIRINHVCFKLYVIRDEVSVGNGCFNTYRSAGSSVLASLGTIDLQVSHLGKREV